MRRTSGFTQFVLGSAVFMGLGWQLPGNATGVFLALWLCIVLRIEARRAAPILAIAALSLFETSFLLSGYTLAGATNPWSPVTGVASAGMRGFVFGAFLGLGLVLQRLGLPKFYALVLGFTLVCAGTLSATYAFRSGSLPDVSIGHGAVISVALNQDLWAGLLLGTLSLLLGLWAFGLHRVPMRLALYGAAGGAAGCALCLLLPWIVNQTRLPVIEAVLKPWILGATLGGACGWCALSHRDELSETIESTVQEPWSVHDYKVLGLSTAAVIFAYYVLYNRDRYLLLPPHGVAHDFLDTEWPIAMFVCAFSSCLMLWSARSSALAWLIAIAVPVVASLTGLLGGLPMGVNSTSATFVIGLPLLTLLFVAGGVYLWQSRANQPLVPMALALLWICSGCALLAAPVDAVWIASETGGAVFRAMLLCAGTTYCTLALWPWREFSDAPPAVRPA